MGALHKRLKSRMGCCQSKDIPALLSPSDITNSVARKRSSSKRLSTRQSEYSRAVTMTSVHAGRCLFSGHIVLYDDSNKESGRQLLSVKDGHLKVHPVGGGEGAEKSVYLRYVSKELKWIISIGPEGLDQVNRYTSVRVTVSPQTSGGEASAKEVCGSSEECYLSEMEGLFLLEDIAAVLVNGGEKIRIEGSASWRPNVVRTTDSITLFEEPPPIDGDLL